MFCSNCGQELAPDSKFCSNCGAPVNAGASLRGSTENERERERREDFERSWGSSHEATTDAASEPESQANDSATDDGGPGYDSGFANRKAQWEIDRDNIRQPPTDEWSMTDLGPAKPQRRRTWLWVLLGIIAVIVIACCVFGWWRAS